MFANTKYISEWRSKGLYDETIKPSPTSDNSLTPLIDYCGYNIRAKFNGSILRPPKVSLAESSSPFQDPTLKKLFICCGSINKK